MPLALRQAALRLPAIGFDLRDFARHNVLATGLIPWDVLAAHTNGGLFCINPIKKQGRAGNGVYFVQGFVGLVKVHPATAS